MMPNAVKRWVIFLMATLLFVLSQFYRSSIAVITPDLMRDLAVTPRGLSLISAAFFYAFALTQIPITLYLDQIGPRIAMTALSLVAAGGALVFAAGHTVHLLTVGRILMGIGMACNLMGTLKLITLWFTPLRFATLSAIVFSLGTLGNLVAATPLVLLTQALGWRGAFLVIAGFNLLLTLLFYLIARDGPAASPTTARQKAAAGPSHTMLADMGRLFGRKDYWIISLGTFCRYGIFAAVQSLWAGPFLIQAMGIAPVQAGNLLVLLSIGLLAGSPLWGWLSDTVLKKRKVIVIAGLFSMGLLLLLLTRLTPGTALPVFGVLFFAFGFCSSAGNIMYAHIKERMPPEKAGAAMTGINFFTMTGVAFFMQGLGHLMALRYPQTALSAAAFNEMFLLCAVCLWVTAAVYLATRETSPGR